MEEIKLDVYVRDQIGSRKIKSIRHEDFVPAVIYGGNQKGSTPIKVDRRAYERAMRFHQGQSVIFHLNVLEGDKKLNDYSAIVKEEQHEPVSDSLVHIDFHHISLTEEIEVKVRVVTKGEPVGVKEGGLLDHAVWELDVICLPTNIPEKIEVNVSELNIGDAVHVKDLVLPQGVRTKHDPEGILVSVVEPMQEVKAGEGEEAAVPGLVGEEKKEGEAEDKGESKAEGKSEEKADKKGEEKKPKEK